MDSNLLLWLGQVLLALGFLGASYGHTLAFETSSKSPGREWLATVGRDRMRVIGSLEVLGAVGLVLPMATGVLPWLTPAAALCLGLLMVFAIVFHARRTGETPNIVLNVILGSIAFLIAFGRLVVSPV